MATDDVFSGWVLGMVNSELASQLNMIPESANLSQFDTVYLFDIKLEHAMNEQADMTLFNYMRTLIRKSAL